MDTSKPSSSQGYSPTANGVLPAGKGVWKKNPKRLRIFFVRHAETTANASHMAQGHGQGELTERGRVQAALLGRKLALEPFDRIYCSDLQRTSETLNIALKEMAAARARATDGRPPSATHCMDAQAVSAALAAAVEYQTVLRERDVGPAFEGQPYGAVQAAAQAAGGPPRAFRPPGGESWEDVYARAGSFLLHLARTHLGGASQPQGETMGAPDITAVRCGSNITPVGVTCNSRAEEEEGSGHGPRAVPGVAQLHSPVSRGSGRVQQILVVTHGGFIKELVNVILAHQEMVPPDPHAGLGAAGTSDGLSGAHGGHLAGCGLPASGSNANRDNGGAGKDANVEVPRVLSCGMSEAFTEGARGGACPLPHAGTGGASSASTPTYHGTAKNTAIYKVELSLSSPGLRDAPRDAGGEAVSTLEDLNLTLVDGNNVTHLFCKEAALMFKAMTPSLVVARPAVRGH